MTSRITKEHITKLVIHHIDALKVNLNTIAKADDYDDKKALRIIGNLPYNISTPLIFRLLSSQHPIADMHFMLQKEVVERITASPGGKDYGRLSIMVQYHCQCEYLFFVAPGAFNPPPKVDSAIVRLTPYQQRPYVAHDETRFANIVAQAFTRRRKTLRNALKEWITPEQWEQIHIDPTLRPENLSVEHYVALSNLDTPLK